LCVAQNVVCHRHKRILFAEHFAVFAYNGKSVYIGVNDKAYICSYLTYLITDGCEMLG